MDEATKKGWITITVPFEEVDGGRFDSAGTFGTWDGRGRLLVTRSGREVSVMVGDLHEAIARAWPASEPVDRSWRLAHMAERHAEIEARGGGITMSGMEAERAHRDRRDLLREIREADGTLAALGVKDDGRPLAERIRAFEADMRAIMGASTGSLLDAARDGEEAWGEVVAERDKLQAEVDRLRAAVVETDAILVQHGSRPEDGPMEDRVRALLDEMRGRGRQEGIDEAEERAGLEAGCARGEHRKAGETMPLSCADCGVDFADLEDDADAVEKEREEATDDAFAEAIRIVEGLKGRAVASPEEMRQAALVALTLRSSDLAQLAADPARRAAFNAHPGLPPRIAILDPAKHPLRPGAARMREHLNGSFASLADKPIQLADLAKALRIREEDMRAIEAGEKTTNADGWSEIQTVLFMLGAGTPAEEIADPIGSGALDRALARAEEPGKRGAWDVDDLIADIESRPVLDALHPPPEPDEADQTVGDLDPGPYVCAGCHTVADRCLPGCVDAEIARRREEDVDTDPGEDEDG